MALRGRRVNREICRLQLKFSMALIIDCQLSRQKIRQKISVIITNTCVFAQFSLVFAVFKTKHELKCQNELFFNIIKRVCFDN